MKFYKFIMHILVIVLLMSCRNDDHDHSPKGQQTYKIGVILPLSGPDKSDWNNATDWVLENIEASGLVADGHIELVWFDSYTNDVVEIATQICQDTTICAAIGPFTSAESFKVANYFIDAKKPLILPTATSEEISSAFSGKKYIWRLAESDISQCQTLLIIAKNKGAKKVALITDDDPYGLTFYNWFGFLATEMDMEVTYLEKYDQSTESPDNHLEKALASAPDILVAIPKNTQQAVAMAKIWRNSNSQTQILFSDVAYKNGFLDGLGQLAEGIEGSAYTSNPATGFEIAYQQRYNTTSTLGMAQIYDAVLLLAYALQVSEGQGRYNLAKALMDLSDGTGLATFWDKDGINRAMKWLRNDQHPKIYGASGQLKFSSDFYTDILSSTYLHWQVYNHQFLNLSHYSSDGKGRISRLAAAWQSYASKTQFFDTTFHIDLPQRQNLWAMVISTSQGWSNYRHQADALRVYHLLKSQQITDDHIIFCMADDLANNSRNPIKGTIKDALTGENLYQDFELDYKTNDLNAKSILDIIAGNRSAKIPTVINSTQNDDLLLYFVSHGDPDGLIINSESNDRITPTEFKSVLESMYANKKYRRILICIEACYSGVFQDCEGIPSVLWITAANRFESSKPVIFDASIDAWLSNQFTNEWLKLVQANPDISFSELYLQLCKTVYGSHACIFNASYYGNVYNNTLKEFVIP